VHPRLKICRARDLWLEDLEKWPAGKNKVRRDEAQMQK
jgi:hypothetical protein